MFSDRGGGKRVERGMMMMGVQLRCSHRAVTVALLSQEGDEIILKYNEARMKRNGGNNRG